MKINDANVAGSAAQTGRAPDTQRVEREASSRAGGAGAQPNGDRVELSNAMGSLSRVLSTFGSSRADRVQALAVQYQSGQYQPDALGTSRGIVAEVLAGGDR